jgi:hypothetical protein
MIGPTNKLHLRDPMHAFTHDCTITFLYTEHVGEYTENYNYILYSIVLDLVNLDLVKFP